MNDTTPETQNPSVRPSIHSAEEHEPGQAEAGELPELARHGDPSQTRIASASGRRVADAAQEGHGVVWVRPSDLLGQVTARAAGRGIDFHAELTRRARRARRPGWQAVAASRRAISERARRLPPVTVFGHHGHSSAGVTRSGIGLR